MLLPSLASLLTISSLASATTNLLDVAKKQEDSSPAAALEEPTDGLVVGHLFPACNGHRIGGRKKPLAVPVDRCFTTPGLGLVIKQAGVCTNGTRAKMARFTDSKCGRGTIDPYLGLIDIPDQIINTCITTAYINTGSEEDKKKKKISSMAFWCDGVKKTRPEDDPPVPEKPKERKGSVSESVCISGKMPLFNHPKIDTCVNMRTDKMRIYSAGVCTNGTQSTLALYKERGCAGGPSAFMDITEEETKSCMDFTGTSSFAFYCTGDIVVPTPRHGSKGDLNRGRSGGGAMHFFLILALICLMFFLMLVLSVLAWVRKYGGGVGKLVEFFSGLFKPKDGGIAL